MATSYRDHPEAIRALVQPDRVHRDLYIDPELFALEQEHFFANTWNYVGHDSQLPKAGTTLAPATLRELREAALADEHGAKLKAMLAQHALA